MSKYYGSGYHGSGYHGSGYYSEGEPVLDVTISHRGNAVLLIDGDDFVPTSDDDLLLCGPHYLVISVNGVKVKYAAPGPVRLRSDGTYTWVSGAYSGVFTYRSSLPAPVEESFV